MAFAKAADANDEPLVKYVMRVAETPSFDEYCRANIGKRRDAIYRYGPNADGVWVDNGYGDHDPTKIDHGIRDKGGRHVLVATEFVHFGDKPRNLIFELMPFCDKRGLQAQDVAHELWHRNRGQSKYCSDDAFAIFLEWVSGLPSDTVTPSHHAPFPIGRASGTRSGACR